MKNIISYILIFLFCYTTNAQVTITEISTLPERISNNAVCEGFIDGTPYIFSFGGIDSTKLYTGIHLKSFRYNTLTGKTIQIPDLPDTLGKIAMAASRIGNIIYIAGGYHVFKDDSELSSNKMHRYDIKNNVFLDDGADIPTPIDDHVQALWRDSLLFIVTGWSNKTNVSGVQIYNPATDSWVIGSSTSNDDNYKSFGASGIIVKDTIYYFGGARSSKGFGIQNQLRKGIINPSDPSQITWSISTPDSSINGYRMACTAVDENIYWIGGSTVTYNYNGVAYNGSGGVPPSSRIVWTSTNNVVLNKIYQSEIPMDLRGVANVSDKIKYIAGGMMANQTVTNKIYKIEFNTAVEK